MLKNNRPSGNLPSPRRDGGDLAWKRYLYLILGLCLPFFSSCAYLSRPVPVNSDQRGSIESAFRKMLAERRDCPSAVEASVSVKFSSLLNSGMVDGYLQARAPSFMKFVGLNPFGQPMMIFATDGSVFRYLSVLDATCYMGSVAAKGFKKYAPADFEPESGFFWLTGRLPAGPFIINEISGAGEHGNYWLDIQYQDSGVIDRVLFNEAQGVILRHAVTGPQAEKDMDVVYENYQQNSDCALPQKVTVRLPRGGIEATMSWEDSSLVSQNDFLPAVPPGFSSETVK